MKPFVFVMMLSSLAVSLLNAQEPASVVPKHYKVAAAEAPTHSVTPDGRFRLYAEEVAGGGDHLFLRDLATGESRPLTEGPGTAGDAIMSPDGRLIAYEWATPAYEWATEDRLIELRIVGIDGSGPRVLYSNRDVLLFNGARLNLQLHPPLRIHDWSPDGKYVAAALFHEDQSQLVLFSVADPSARVLRRQGIETLSYISYFGKMKFSPDGRFVAYDLTPHGGSSRDIFAIPAEGGSDVPLVQNPANDILLDWTPDGRGVLFASNRSGHWDLWVMPVFDGKPSGSPQMVYPNIEPFNGLGFTPDGSYYYGVTVWENDVYLATLDPATYRLRGPTRLVSHVGYRTSTQWSRDGQYLAYAWGRGSENDPFILGIRFAETGKERRHRLGELHRHGGHGFDPQWSPDGRFILADLRERGYVQSQGLHRIDVQTGSVTPLVQAQAAAIHGYNRIESPAWSPDGRVIFERHPPQRILTRDLKTGKETELYRPVPPAQVHHWPTSNLAVSPDGQRLAFVWTDAKNVERTTALMVLPTAGGEPRELFRAQEPAVITVPAWTPDSRHIIYARTVAGEKGMFEFWRISPEGGEPQNLGLKMEARVPYGLSVHPDGTRIAFTAGTEARSEVWVLKDFLPAVKAGNQKKIVFDSERDGHEEVYVMDPDSSHQQRLTHTSGKGGASWVPAWSPDRKRIAFASNREGNLEVYEMDADGSNVQRRTHTPGKESENPAWSPDGRRIAFASNRDGNMEIYVIDTDGSNVHRLTHTKGRGKSNENPDWSPDGKRIVFDSNRDGKREIYVTDGDGSNVKRLTYTPGTRLGSEHPAWSPDGKRIAFDSSRDRTSKNWLRTAEIYVMNADGSNVDRLSNTTAMGRSSLTPVWSPDGKKIAFGSNRDGKAKKPRDNFEMYVMDADGSNVRRLTFNQAWDGHPYW